MSSKSIDLSEKIDALTREIFCLVHDVAVSLSIDFFVIGATARDLILHYVHGLRQKRATQDIDLAIEVAEWAVYDRLRLALIETGEFTACEQPQRIIHKSLLPVDIVPFGGIAAEDCQILWPPDEAMAMNLLGFQEAYASSQLIRLRSSPPVDVAVATPAGLTPLKMIAWSDVPFDMRSKHALDLAFILNTYLDIGNAERVFEEHPDLLTEDFDYELAGARLLGRDTAQILSPRTRAQIRRILEFETSERGSLPNAMSGRSAALPPDRCLRLLQAFALGLDDRTGQ